MGLQHLHCHLHVIFCLIRVLYRDDTDHFRMEEEMARLVADNEAAKAKNESLERRLASLQNDFVR